MITMAYSHDDARMDNDFTIGDWKTVFAEEFSSPSGWITCETIDKTITVKNEADADASVRIIIEEQWMDKNGNVLPVVSTSTGHRLAQINFTANSGWTEKPGGYYYYDVDLHKNETTSSLTTGVTLNCDVNLEEDVEYSNATYHLKYTAQSIQADRKAAWHYNPNCESNILYDTIACQTNGLDTNIDYTTAATASNNNGEGVNTFAAKSEEYYPVFYYRGMVENNYVIWGGKCWRAVRTTTRGGVKLIYGGEPTSGQCISSDVNIQYDNKSSFPFNRLRTGNGSWEPSYYTSPAFSGYMYGDIIYDASVSVFSGNISAFYIASDIERNGNNYTLSGDIVQIRKNSFRDNVMRRHYICSDGQLSCNSAKLGYVTYAPNYSLYYLKIGGYDDVEAAKRAMFNNVNDSPIKTVVEGWFESAGLANRENDLDDEIYCNDRSIAKGALKSNNSALNIESDGVSSYSGPVRFGAYSRIEEKNSDNNFSPSLDCPNKNDSFTMSDTVKGNGKLAHKVGLLTEDEVTLAGTIFGVYADGTHYASTALIPGWLKESRFWTMTPKMYYFWSDSTHVAYVNDGTFWNYDRDSEYGGTYGVRPVVTLKAGMEYTAGADGTKTNPYVIE